MVGSKEQRQVKLSRETPALSSHPPTLRFAKNQRKTTARHLCAIVAMGLKWWGRGAWYWSVAGFNIVPPVKDQQLCTPDQWSVINHQFPNDSHLDCCAMSNWLIQFFFSLTQHFTANRSKLGQDENIALEAISFCCQECLNWIRKHGIWWIGNNETSDYWPQLL